MYGYIYMTTNLVNGNRYIGKRKKDFYSDPYYIGSGTLLSRAKAKYGYDNFKKELLEECDSLEQLNERERYWIDFYDAVNDPHFYNMRPGGDGGDISLFMSDEDMERIRKEHSEYISNRLSTDEDFHDKFAGAKDGHAVYEDTKQKISDSKRKSWGDMDPDKKHDILSRSASTRNKGRSWMTNDVEEVFAKPYEVDRYLALGYRDGRKFKRRNRKCATTIESVTDEKYISE